MKLKTEDRSNEIGVWIGVAVIIGLVIYGSYWFAVWTDHNLDFWISYFKGHPVHVPLWLAFILGCALNCIALAANVIAEIAKYLI